MGTKLFFSYYEIFLKNTCQICSPLTRGRYGMVNNPKRDSFVCVSHKTHSGERRYMRTAVPFCAMRNEIQSGRVASMLMLPIMGSLPRRKKKGFASSHVRTERLLLSFAHLSFREWERNWHCSCWPASKKRLPIVLQGRKQTEVALWIGKSYVVCFSNRKS